MTVSFKYNKDKDVWCLLNYGKTSMNSPTPTKMYEELKTRYGNSPTEEQVISFVNEYKAGKDLNEDEYIKKYTEDWQLVSEKYQEIAERVFGMSLPSDVTAYLTINNRCPYSVEENMFFVQMPAYSSRKTAMHELWHFYTWQAFGKEEEEKLGKQKNNEVKEALTVLLNVECKDLLPNGITDNGYPQHKELRDKILVLWQEGKDIKSLWSKITNP
jgi:hypothetical protein